MKTDVIKRARLAEVSAVVLGAGIGTRVLETRGARVADPEAVERVMAILRNTSRTLGESITLSDDYRRYQQVGFPRRSTFGVSGPRLVDLIRPRSITIPSGYAELAPTGRESLRPGPTSLLDLLTVVELGSSRFPHFEETTATLSEASGKPFGVAAAEAAESFARTDMEMIRLVLASGAVDRKVAEDSNVFNRWLDRVLVRGFRLGFEKQILVGSGVRDSTQQNLTGITVDADVVAVARAATLHLDHIAEGRKRLEDNGYIDHVVVANPADLKTIRIAAKDAPGSASKILENVPLLAAKALTAGTTVVLAPEGITLFTRGQSTVRISDEHSDLWLRNQIMGLIVVEVEMALDHRAAIELTGM